MLVSIGVITVFSLFTVILSGVFEPPISPGEFGALLLIVMVANAIGLGCSLLWDRITRNRQRDRLSG